MRFTVVWMPDALAQLAECWNQSSDRNGLTKAANQVDALLRFDPNRRGVEYYGDRLLTVSSLHVIFRVRPDDMLVEILQVL